MTRTNNKHYPPDSVLSPVWSQAIVQGTAIAVSVALGAYIAHFPAIGMATSTSVVILGCILVVGFFWCGTGAPTRRRALVLGALTALVAASLTALVVVSSTLVQQPEPGQSPAPGASGLRPGAIGASVWFVVGSVVLGSVLAMLGHAAIKGPRWFLDARAAWTTRTTQKRMAIVLAGALVPLIATGGLVTSTRSGLAIADWPSSDSAYMFFYPLSLMGQQNIYFEHTHRLFGTLVGIAAIFALVLTWTSDTSRKTRFGITIAFVLICVQGYLGGARVEEKSQGLAVVHGVLAQIVVALVVACIVWQSNLYRSATMLNPSARDRKIKVFGTAFLHTSTLQLILGASFRHLKASGSSGANHALWTHLGFSAIVLLCGIAAGAMLIARSDHEKDGFEPTARRLGWLAIGSLSIQLVLGFMALFAVMETLGQHGAGPIPTAQEIVTMPQVPWSQAIITAAHQFNGVIVLATAAAICVWGRWLNKHTASASAT